MCAGSLGDLHSDVIVRTIEPPGGIAPTSAIIPAVTNAIFPATSMRLLPIDTEQLKSV